MKEGLSRQFTVIQAVMIAREAHAEQLDKAGRPYIDHPLAVMSQLRGDEARMVGILHDVVEDSTIGFEQLQERGVPQSVIDAVRLVTHGPDYGGSEEEYWEDIHRIADSGNQLAIDVKWADLTHNSDISRIANPVEKDFRRVKKYAAAKDILRPHVSEYLREENK